MHIRADIQKLQNKKVSEKNLNNRNLIILSTSLWSKIQTSGIIDEDTASYAQQSTYEIFTWKAEYRNNITFTKCHVNVTPEDGQLMQCLWHDIQEKLSQINGLHVMDLEMLSDGVHLELKRYTDLEICLVMVT